MALSIDRSAVRPDELRRDNFSECVRRLRAFLVDTKIAQVRAKVRDRMRDGNRFRELRIRQKQPWLEAFEYYDRLTFNGTRPLRPLAAPHEVWLAAMAGLALTRVGPTLSEALKASTRNRLLDIDGKALSVLAEWDMAHFYLRHGHRLVWTEPGQRGPEFRSTREGLSFDVECKHVGAQVAERTTDPTGLGLGFAVARAFDAVGLGGEVVLETPLTNEDVVVEEIIARVRAAFARGGYNGEINLGPFGMLTGNLRRRRTIAPAALNQQLDRHVLAVPPGVRYYATTLPVNVSPPNDFIFLELRGPRRTARELFEHLERELIGGCEQFRGDVPGVLTMEFASVDDVRKFNADAFFALERQVFERFPAVAAVVWRCRKPADHLAVQDQWGVAARNANCTFRGTDAIVLNDAQG